MTTRRVKTAPETAHSGEPSPPQDNRETQLLLIARQLFASKGFDRTSLRDIADEAKITKAALYYYFP
ncbi:MAG: helix-turn-helix transcriptional regulator, partial [Rhodoferax sp.]|nr:helix-turn-helix transcriptional regulator [Rhodoferax sp.]